MDYMELDEALRLYVNHYKYFYKLTGVPIAAAILVMSARIQELAKQVCILNGIERSKK